MGAQYKATVSRVSDEGFENVSSATGSFAVANFAVKEGLGSIKDSAGEYRVTFEALDESGETRNVVSVSGDADVVTYVAKKKIAAERKALNGADADETPASE